MTTSQIPFLHEINSGSTIPPEKMAYFEDRFRGRLYDLIISEFKKQQAENGLTQKKVADRLGKRPEQINRWLAAPGNWTLDTVSNLLLAICKGELEIGVSVLSEQSPRNRRRPDWLKTQLTQATSVKTTANSVAYEVTTEPLRILQTSSSTSSPVQTSVPNKGAVVPAKKDGLNV